MVSSLVVCSTVPLRRHVASSDCFFPVHSVCTRIKIEEEYAKNLSKLSQIPLAAQEEGYVEEFVAGIVAGICVCGCE